MAYRTLLACLTSEAVADAVLEVGVALAERHAAHLTGLHVLPPLEPLGYYAPAFALVPNEAWARERDAIAERLRERFDAATQAAGFVSEWRVMDEPGAPERGVLSAIGNTSDLVVLGLHPDPALRGARDEIAGSVLTACARPALLVPPERVVQGVGERVFVAWDGGRAATRALFGALPLMRRADAVRLQRMNAPKGDRHQVLGTVEDLASTLARHGVTVELFTADARDADIGTELLGYARDWGADVMVAGAYERSAFRETVFGSTTRHLLQHATLPILASV